MTSLRRGFHRIISACGLKLRPEHRTAGAEPPPLGRGGALSGSGGSEFGLRERVVLLE